MVLAAESIGRERIHETIAAHVARFVERLDEAELVTVLRRFRRQALHAASLSFDHPLTSEAVHLSVDPPDDFLRLLDVMRADARLAAS